MRTIQFTEAQASDADIVAALHAESWRSAYVGMLPDDYLADLVLADRRHLWTERMKAAKPERRLVLLAKLEGQLAGFVCVLLDEEPAWGARLDNLHVRPDLKGRGLGRSLMAEAAEWVMRQAPGSRMHLMVYEANEPARRFYETLGGELAERHEEDAPGGSRLVALRYVWSDLNGLATRAAGAV